MNTLNNMGPMIVMRLAGAVAATLVSFGANASPQLGSATQVLNPAQPPAAILVCEAKEFGSSSPAMQKYTLNFYPPNAQGQGSVSIYVPFHLADGRAFLSGAYQKTKITQQTRLKGYDQLQIHGQTGPNRLGKHKLSFQLVGTAQNSPAGWKGFGNGTISFESWSSFASFGLQPKSLGLSCQQVPVVPSSDEIGSFVKNIKSEPACKKRVCCEKDYVTGQMICY